MTVFRKASRTVYLWAGKKSSSLEHCIVEAKGNDFTVKSVITGLFDRRIHLVEYAITINSKWQTVAFDIKSHLNGQVKQFSFASDGKGSWTKKGRVIKKFTGCIVIDISLTPFTNTLAINRLGLNKKEQQQVKAVYINLFENEIKPVYQKYTRLSATRYKYENVPTILNLF